MTGPFVRAATPGDNAEARLRLAKMAWRERHDEPWYLLRRG